MAQQEEEQKAEVRFALSGTFECVSKEHIATFKALMGPVVAITNKEKGCIHYNLYQDNQNECIFSIFEEWESQSDFAAHCNAEHYRSIVFSDRFKEIVKTTFRVCTAPVFLGKDDLAGLTIPEMDIFTFSGGPSKVSTSDLFSGKKVVVFAVPGSFTPSCQEKHAPSFVEKHEALKKLGVDNVYCLAVNDPFVLNAFVKQIGGEGKIGVLADFDGAFCKTLGDKTIDASAFGLGIRAKRFSFYAVDGVIQQYFEEEDPSQVTVAAAGTLVDAIEIKAAFLGGYKR